MTEKQTLHKLYMTLDKSGFILTQNFISPDLANMITQETDTDLISSKATQPTRRRILHLEYSSYSLPDNVNWA